MRKRRGFTLLELILALGLTVIVVGLVSMAVGTQLRLAATGRAQVQEAQLARALLHRIADDLHNAAPYSAKGMPGTGLFGSMNQLQLDVCRPASISPSAAAAAVQDPAAAGRALGVRTVCYYLGEPGDVPAAEEDAGGPPGEVGGASAAGSGLIRTEVSRAVASWAAQQGGGDPSQLGPATIVPEVVDIQFAYYDSTGTENDQWDSQQQQGLPYAVKASVTIRRPSRKPAMAVEGPTEDRAELAVYSLLVPLANIVPSASTSDTSTGATATAGTASGPAAGSGSPALGTGGYSNKGSKGGKRGDKGGKGGEPGGKGGQGGEAGGKGGQGGEVGGKGGKGGEVGGKGGKGGRGGQYGGKGGRGGKGGEYGGKGGRGTGFGPRGGNGNSFPPPPPSSKPSDNKNTPASGTKTS